MHLRQFFDWLSRLRPRQLLALAGVTAVIIFFIMYIALTMLLKSSYNAPPLEEQQPEQTTEENKPPEIKMVNVVVATENIEPRSMLVSRFLGTQEVPENMMPPDAVTDIAEVANKPARERIFKGDVITRSKVYQNAAMAGFVGSIPPDCRAVSIDVSDVTGVAGFAKPGDYVDDILLIEKDDTTVTSRLILQDVLLLSINQNMGVRGNYEGEEDKESSVNPETRAIDNPTLATFALRPDEILQLVSASRIGEIYLMLRPLVPQSDYITGAEYTIESLKGQRLKQEELLKKQAELANQQQTPAPINETPAPPERIKIFYGDEIGLNDVNNMQNATINKSDSGENFDTEENQTQNEK